MKLNAFVDRLLKTNWTAERIGKYIGKYQKTFFSCALDESIRNNAASGGSVTAILDYLLQSGEIDGALICRSVVENGQVKPEFHITVDRAGLIQAQGSKYSATRFTGQAIPLMEDFDGRLAVVTLPCDAKNLARYRKNHPALDSKIALVITLFCGHNSEPELTGQIVNKLRPDEKQLIDFRYRSGHWRGQMTATYEGNQVVVKPFSYFSDYQNLYFFCEQKCLHCHDHTGYDSDISAGDIWLQKMKDDPIKHNALIVRTEPGLKAVIGASEAQILSLEEKPIEEICEGQSRSLKLHYNISARAKAGKLFKENIQDVVAEKVHWHDYLLAYLFMQNRKFSLSKTGRKIISLTPRPLIKLYLYLIKGLEIL